MRQHLTAYAHYLAEEVLGVIFGEVADKNDIVAAFFKKRWRVDDVDREFYTDGAGDA